MSFIIESLNVNLEQVIDKVLSSKAQNNDRDYSHFHPSEFDKCHRKLVYKYYEFKGLCSASEPNASLIKPRIQRIFDNGHSLHERLGENLAATPFLKGRWQCKECGTCVGGNEKLGIHLPGSCEECGQKKWGYREIGFLDDETMIGGHVDAILDLRGRSFNGIEIPKDASEEDSHLVVDFKSINSRGFRQLAGPMASHITQLQIYLYLSGLRAGKFLYENKDDQSFREFFVARDESIVETKVDEAKKLKRIVTRTNSKGQYTLPLRLHKKDNTRECVECAFRSHCWRLVKEGA